MTTLGSPPQPALALPDHAQLPETDGAIVENFQEHPQSILLSTTIMPVLERRHPDNLFAVGQDSGIYWRLTDPPLDGCKAPDWFYIPNVAPLLKGKVRRSYVLWQELLAPLILIEYVSGDGSEERDRTPERGKFWVYEQAVRAPYYAIYEADPGLVEVYRLVDGTYQLLAANERGHFPIAPLGVELGIWQGRYFNLELPWLRWWDAHGNLLPTSDELIQIERQRSEELIHIERQRADRLAAQLRNLGVEPEERARREHIGRSGMRGVPRPWSYCYARA